MSRIIDPQVRTSALHIAECVRALFALELLSPGSHLYLCAEEFGNPPVLDNRIGQFGVLFPEIEIHALRLDQTLWLLNSRGVRVRLIHTAVNGIEKWLPALSEAVEHRQASAPLFHQGLLSSKLGLRGKLYFNAETIDSGAEKVNLVTEPIELQRFALELESYWEELA